VTRVLREELARELDEAQGHLARIVALIREEAQASAGPLGTLEARILLDARTAEGAILGALMALRDDEGR
jgi:hypothetical protein